MRKNLTIFGTSLSLLFIGLAVIICNYPNDFSLSLSLADYSLNVNNNLAYYLSWVAALIFGIIGFIGLVSTGKDRYVADSEGLAGAFGGCSSGFYHGESGLIVCLNCGTGLEGDYIACPTCGQEVYQDCPSCKEIVPTWHNVCPYCGYDLVVFELVALPDEDDEDDSDE